MINVTSKIPIGPFHGVSDVLGPTIRLFCDNFWLITKIVFVIVAPFEIFKAFSLTDIENDWQLASGVFLLNQLCKVLIAPALIFALMKVTQTSNAPGVNESYRWGFGRLGKLIPCAAVAAILQGLGFAMCFIPGIIIYLALTLVYPIAVLETGSVSEILRESNNRTGGHLWKIFAATLVIWLLVAVTSLPAHVTAPLANDAVLAPLAVAAAILADIMEQATTVLSLVIYLSIRALWRGGTQY